MKKRNYLIRLIYFATIICCFSFCIEKYGDNRNSLYNFNYNISNDEIYSTHIYNENKMIAKYVAQKDKDLLFVKVFISDDNEEEIIGRLYLNVDTIELSYVHEEPNWFKRMFSGVNFLVEVYELNYYISDLDKSKNYFIRFNNQFHSNKIEAPIKLKNVKTTIPPEWTVEWRKKRLKKKKTIKLNNSTTN